MGIKNWMCWLALHKKDWLSKRQWSLMHTSKKENGHIQKFTDFYPIQAVSQYSKAVNLNQKIKLKAIEDSLHYIHIFEIAFFLAEGNSVS